MTPPKPKRPLSSYNLFYRFKRSKILEAHENGDDSKETCNRLITAMPGLEDFPPAIGNVLFSNEDMLELRRTKIRLALQDKISPKDCSKRTHRKSHGAMTFLEMNKIMCTSWKSIDDFGRGVFEELADEGRSIYHKRVAEHDEKYPSAPKKKIKTNSSPLVIATPKKTEERLAAELILHKSIVEEFVSQNRHAVLSDTKVAVQEKSADKDTDRPKRPLSSYNLFYRFKRSKVLQAQMNGDYSKETSTRLITAMPGLEDFPSIASTISSDDEVAKEIRRNKIRAVLLKNLSPKDSNKRTHRRSNGTMSFLEMGKIMSTSWKSIDDFAMGVFEELANEGRIKYHKRVAEFEGKFESSPTKKIKMSKKIEIDVPTHPVNDFILNAPVVAAAEGGGVSHFVPALSPTCVASSFSDVPNLFPESLPLFPDIFDLTESSDDEPIRMIGDSYTSYTGSSHGLNDFSLLPFSHIMGEKDHREHESELSGDDFMRLIDSLGP